MYTGSPGHFSAFGIEKKRVSAFDRVIRGSAYLVVCLVPVGLLPRPSRSMHFGDVSVTNGWEHGTRNESVARNNEA